MARVYADVNQNMPRSYWDYDSVNISELMPQVDEGVWSLWLLGGA